jgi:hypothetical protein
MEIKCGEQRDNEAVLYCNFAVRSSPAVGSAEAEATSAAAGGSTAHACVSQRSETRADAALLTQGKAWAQTFIPSFQALKILTYLVRS